MQTIHIKRFGSMLYPNAYINWEEPFSSVPCNFWDTHISDKSRLGERRTCGCAGQGGKVVSALQGSGKQGEKKWGGLGLSLDKQNVASSGSDLNSRLRIWDFIMLNTVDARYSWTQYLQTASYVKFICNSKIDNQSASVVLMGHVRGAKNLSHLTCMLRAQTEEGIALYFVSALTLQTKSLFTVYWMPCFSTFCAFCWWFHYLKCPQG